MRFRSLKTQVLVWFGTITTILLLIFNITFYQFLEENIKLTIQNKLYNKAVFINDNLKIGTPIKELLAQKQLASFEIAIIKDEKIIYKKGEANFKKLSSFVKEKKSFFIFTQGDSLNGLYVFKIYEPFKGEIDDKIEGLTYGADDYMSKPFSFKELLARSKALYRRSISVASNSINIKDIIINIDAKSVTKDKQELELAQKEYELLLFLAKNKNKIVSNSMIEEQLWNNEEYINSNVIQVTIYNLRKKLGKEFIKSSRGLGYKIEV